MTMTTTGTVLLLLTCVCVCVLAMEVQVAPVRSVGDGGPVLPSQYAATMHEHWVSAQGASYTWNITTSYNYDLKSQYLHHSIGQYDEICLAAGADEGQECEEYINPHARYVYLPDTDKCCWCCLSESGPIPCGVVKPTWAQEGKYNGKQVVDMGDGHNITCDEYLVQGAFVNHFLVSSDFVHDSGKVMPCQFHEAKPGKVNIKEITYQLDGWNDAPQPASNFVLPAACNSAPQCGGICHH